MTATVHLTSPLATSTLDKTLRIVMADDDRNDQLLTVMAAEEAGHPLEFTFVDDGSDLLQMLSGASTLDELPDAIVLDLRMPVLDGHRTLDRLQAHPVLWQIPVIIFTTSSRNHDRSMSRDLGAREFETKPSDFAGMVAFVHRVAIVAAGRLPYRDEDGDLEKAPFRRSLTGPDLASDVDDILIEELDLLDEIDLTSDIDW
jgi:CheY-like chemotaxis protein